MAFATPSLESETPPATVEDVPINTPAPPETVTMPALDNSSTSRLMSLPPELRLIIYSHLFSELDPRKHKANILIASRTIRCEAMCSYFARVQQLIKELQTENAAACEVARKASVDDRVQARVKQMMTNIRLGLFTRRWIRVRERMTRDGFPVQKWLEMDR